MLTRRSLLAVTGGAALAALSSRGAGALAPPVIRLSILQFGSAAWELAAMSALGRVGAGGFALELRRAANNDAGRLAFLAGAVDGVVSDLLWAARLKVEGRDLVYLPFSCGEGAVVVPAGSRLRRLEDLAGARLGVAGGPLDKSWLLLQAHARKAAGIDLAQAAKVAFGAPPLLAAKLEQGELDAALLYWTFAARVEAKGFTRLIAMDDVVAGFGIAPPPALVGYVFEGAFARRQSETLAAFAKAAASTRAALAGSGAEAEAGWAAARPVMQAPDDATFAALRRGFIAGIPQRPPEAERAAAARLLELLAAEGGATLLGPLRTLPEGLYWAGARGL
ncbi:ABC transporter substrate-binding protein [Xanthobacter agilis]|uniref:NitT/TauT family transport system substrate-binding protein n=1 Tax=Xanthobacter agilis TaxID=47492 RepID=A0ABU0LES0_XANAG|nr:ABC transporter substrate-binding protein [Xanthobacter agilis]MDQ0505639.1 NitT/TauT family transport system substrate-binding protein [Xanthobacter agilis]